MDIKKHQTTKTYQGPNETLQLSLSTVKCLSWNQPMLLQTCTQTAREKDTKTDLLRLTTSVNTLTNNLTLLKQNTDSIPKLETTLKGIQDSITSLKVDNASNQVLLKENQVRIQTLKEENSILRTKVEILKCQGRRQVNLKQENIDNLTSCHLRREKGTNSFMFEGVNEGVHSGEVNPDVQYNTIFLLFFLLKKRIWSCVSVHEYIVIIQ